MLKPIVSKFRPDLFIHCIDVSRHSTLKEYSIKRISPRTCPRKDETDSIGTICQLPIAYQRREPDQGVEAAACGACAVHRRN